MTHRPPVERAVVEEKGPVTGGAMLLEEEVSEGGAMDSGALHAGCRRVGSNIIPSHAQYPKHAETGIVNAAVTQKEWRCSR